MLWELKGDIFVCTYSGLPVAFAKQIGPGLFTAVLSAPDRRLAVMRLTNHGVCEMMHEIEAHLRALGWK